MINIVVWTGDSIDIENKNYKIYHGDDLVEFLKDLIDKVYYSGETVCLERGSINEINGRAMFREIERWK